MAGRNPTSGIIKQTGVELVPAVVLRKASFVLAPAFGQHLLFDLIAQRPPALDIPVVSEFFMHPHRAVEGDPRHHFRVGKVPVRTAHFPDSGVGFPPAVFEPGEQALEQRPTICGVLRRRSR